MCSYFTGSGCDYDVYIFYAESDRSSFVHPLCKELKHVGVNAFDDMESVGWGDDKQDALKNGIARSKRAVVVVTESLMSSGARDKSMVLSAFLQRQQTENGKVIYPLLVGDIDAQKYLSTMPFLSSLKELRTTATLDGIQKACSEIKKLCSGSLTPKSQLCCHSERKGNLPLLKAGFIGQDALVNKIVDWLVNDPDCKVCGMGGMPGVGKSMVAAHVAHKLKNQEWRIIFVECRGLKSKEAIAERMIEVMMDQSSIGSGLIGMLCSLQHFDRAESKLLILDHCDDVLEESEKQLGKSQEINPLFTLVSRILANTDNMKVMTTSRIPFKSCRLPAKNVEVYPLSHEDSAQFLRCQYPMMDHEMAWSMKIAEYCGGHPVALNVVLAIVRDGALSPKQVYHHLYYQGLTKFQQEYISRIPLQDRISYCFTEALGMLKPPELLTRLKCLTVFCGPFTLAAAAEVLGLSACKANECAIQPLLERCLLQVSSDPRKFYLQSVLRDYLLECGEGDDQVAMAGAQNRFFALYTQQLDEVAEMFWKDASASLELFDTERQHFKELLKLRQHVPAHLCIKLMGALLHSLPLLKLRLPCLSLSKLLKSCMNNAKQCNQEVIRSRFLVEHSDVLIQMGRHNEALGFLVEARRVLLKDSQDEKYLISLAACYRTTGNALMAADKPMEALYCHRKSRNIHKQMGDRDNSCIASLTSLGRCCAELGLQDDAMSYYEESRKLCRVRLGLMDSSVQRPFGSRVRGVHPYQVALLFHMSETASKEKRHNDALHFIRQGLAMLSKLRASDADRGAVLYAAGVAALLKGDQEDDAIDDICGALVLARREKRCCLLHFFIALILGKITYTGGNLIEAVELLKEAVEAGRSAQYYGDCFVEALAYLCVSQKLLGDDMSCETYTEFNRALVKSHLGNLRNNPAVLLLRSSPQFGQIGPRMPTFEPPLATFCCWRYSDFCRWHPNPGDTLQSPEQLATLSSAAYAHPEFAQYVRSTSICLESPVSKDDTCHDHSFVTTESTDGRHPKLRKSSGSFGGFSPSAASYLSSKPTVSLPVAFSSPFFISGGIVRAQSSSNLSETGNPAGHGPLRKRTLSRSCPSVSDTDSELDNGESTGIVDPLGFTPSDDTDYWLHSKSIHDRRRLSTDAKEALKESRFPLLKKFISVPEKHTPDMSESDMNAQDTDGGTGIFRQPTIP